MPINVCLLGSAFLHLYVLSLPALEEMMIHIILEIANNHCGSVDHGLMIIENFREIARRYEDQIRFGFKFQYRDLDTFIRQDYKHSDHSGVRRFLDTQLSNSQFDILIDKCIESNFFVGATPFDEPSVLKIQEDNRLSFLKIASCSASDWPLLEAIKGSRSRKRLILSTGGCDLTTLDRTVSFLLNAEADLELMHCIAIYPSARDELNLAWLKKLSDRYRLPVGLSTHEEGTEYMSGAVGLAMGAKTFEKHVNIISTQHPMNRYSATPENLIPWIETMLDAERLIGDVDQRKSLFSIENRQLDSFRRGAIAAQSIPVGSEISPMDVVFKFPLEKSQLRANDFSKFASIQTDRTYDAGEIIVTDEKPTTTNPRAIVEDFASYCVGILKDAGIPLLPRLQLEISHHYGLERLGEIGLAMSTVINNESYCKKYLILKKGQKHPDQFHKIKAETFILLKGSVYLWLNGERKELALGEPIFIAPGVVHCFRALDDSVIEEISSTHNPDDSFYLDPKITGNTNRKSLITVSTQ